MELDPHATADLTAFFTKRFPLPTDRAVLARDARVTYREPPSADPQAAWGGLLTRAKEQAALPRLATCAARRLPADENLQGVSAVLNGRTWPPGPATASSMWIKQLGALVALVTIAGLAWAAQRPSGEASATASAVVVDQQDGLHAPAVVSEPSALPEDMPPPHTPPPSQPPVDSVASAATAPSPEAPEGTAAPDGSEESSTPPAAAPAATPQRTGRPAGGSCKAAPGALVGYWYAGPESPGVKGDSITIPRDLNVRADYPDRHNGYDRRTAVQCTLGVGASLVLTADPIAVPGGAYWVPLHAPGG